MNQVKHAYQHSGSSGFSFFLVPFIGVVASLIVAVAYAYATRYNPIVYLSILLPFVYGAAIGFVVSKATVASKCRSTKVAGLLALLVGLVALYCAWAAFLIVLAELSWANLPKLLLSPWDMWQVIVAVNADGWFTISGGTPKGLVLWGMWAAEAVIVLGVVGMMGANSIADRVFCERCRAWVGDGVSVYLEPPIEVSDIQSLAEGNLQLLESLESVEASESPRIQVDTKACAGCQDLYTCRIKAVMMTQDKEGNLTESAQELTPYLLISPDQYAVLGKLAVRSPVPGDAVDGDALGGDQSAGSAPAEGANAQDADPTGGLGL